MYGTVARMQVKPGMTDQLKDAMSEYEDLAIRGGQRVYVYRSDDDPTELWMAVLFESKDAYHANAQAPEQNERYEKMRSFLTADPEWHDGEIIHKVEM